MSLSPSAVEERAFQKKDKEHKREEYLATDVIQRLTKDPGYAHKMELMEYFLRQYHRGGYILDVGSNTAGEAEVLAFRGYDVVASDVNEIALSFSRIRSRRFRSRAPHYVAADVHHLPFADNTFDCVIAFEVLHHFEKIKVALAEIQRVLKPGGHLFTYEPYALNPYRRLAELRFHFMGSIEKSFSKSGLTGLMEGAGLRVLSCDKAVLKPSAWRNQGVSPLRRALRHVYYQVSRRAVPVFGNLVLVAEKPVPKLMNGNSNIQVDLSRSLVCPITGRPLQETEDGFVSTGTSRRYFYRKYNGIPVLIKEDATEVREMPPVRAGSIMPA